MGSLPVSPVHILCVTGGEGNHDVAGLLFVLLVLFTAAKIGAEVFERLNQPAVVGEILAGVLVGPQVLDLVRPSEVTFALSELGAVFLLFLVGLETRPAALARVGKDAGLVALGGVVLPFALGYGFALASGYSQVVALFIGTALVATSVGITARVLVRLGVLHATASRIVLGAAVLDDVLGLLTLAVVSGFARDGTADYRQILLTGLYALAFVFFMTCCGTPVVARARPTLERLHLGHSLYLAAIGLCLALSVAAGYLGVAAIVGAFLAGMAFSEIQEETGLHRWFQGLAEFFVPFFLAGIGMALNLGSLASPPVLLASITLTLLAVIGKLVGCALPLWRRGRRCALQVGVGMVPRGEVGILVARIGLGLGVFGADLFATVLFVSVATTMLAPPLLARLFAGEERRPPGEAPGTAEAGIDLA